MTTLNAEAEGRESAEKFRENNRLGLQIIGDLVALRALLGPTRMVTLGGLSAVVQRFLVSPAIAAIALEQAGYIDADTKREWKQSTTPQLAVRFGWSDQYRALEADSNQRRAPQRLLARAVRGYAEGVLPAQTIATLRGISADDAERELREAGVFPAEPPVRWVDPTELPDVDVDLAALDEALGTADESPGPSEPE